VIYRQMPTVPSAWHVKKLVGITPRILDPRIPDIDDVPSAIPPIPIRNIDDLGPCNVRRDLIDTIEANADVDTDEEEDEDDAAADIKVDATDQTFTVVSSDADNNVLVVSSTTNPVTPIQYTMSHGQPKKKGTIAESVILPVCSAKLAKHRRRPRISHIRIVPSRLDEHIV
jgi:hypothetical protein